MLIFLVFYFIFKFQEKNRLDLVYLVACRLELPSSSSASGDGANDLVAFGVKLADVRFVVVDIF